MNTSTIAAGTVDTRKISDRRRLRFETFEEMWAEVERIAAAERAGRLRRVGNWTAGQIFGHLATWARYPHEGYPRELLPPWFIRLLVRFAKRRFIYGEMPAGVRIPRVKGGTMGTEPMSLDEGLRRLREAWTRLRNEAPVKPNPLFGPMTHEEWIAANLRHAELHLGFLHPE